MRLRPSLISNISLSSCSNLLLASKTTITKSACFNVFFERSTPIDSTLSSISLMPAVSNKCKTIPFKLISPSTMSLVVPAISVTMAFSSPTKAFNNDDLPTLGLPTIATLMPSLIMRACSPSDINLSTEEIISSQYLTIISLLATSIS